MSETSSRGDAAQRAERRHTQGSARASLAVRIVIGVIAALILVVGVLASVNLRAASAFNQATDALNEHLVAAAQETPDYDKLSTLQEQTDAQFRDAAAAGVILLPQIREAIAANAAVSGQLSRYVKDQLAAQEGDTSDQQKQSSSNSSDDSSSSSSGGGLTDEQRQQVEELLKANEQSTPAESDSTATDSSQSQTTNNTGNTSKPW